MKALFRERLLPDLKLHFEKLYGEKAPQCFERCLSLFGRYGIGVEGIQDSYYWTQKDAVLITYADAIKAEMVPHLVTLAEFLREHIEEAISIVHILPFYPSSSDDGYSVKHYRQVDPALGSWEDISSMSYSYRLMFDLVLNHTSRGSKWFHDFCAGIAPARDYFIVCDSSADLSSVTRPRAGPLLSPVYTKDGIKNVWTTFSEDQIDFNFSNPDVLFEMIDILLFYISKGARILRLDAIAYLWKRKGTTCVNLPETHEVVKVFRNILQVVAPDVWLLTETNVPHDENLSYFGHGDEANMVYQFSLPPLVLLSLIKGDASCLSAWASEIQEIPRGCTFLNFTASHDGIGIRPLEGLVPPEWINDLIVHVRRLGGEVSHKKNTDGSEVPYELNITYFDALRIGESDEDPYHVQRFLCSQLISMMLKGVPAFYFNSLLATPNYHEGVAESGKARSINRRKFQKEEIKAILSDSHSVSVQVLEAIKHALRVRGRVRAFNPDAAQRVIIEDPRFFIIERTAMDGSDRVLGIANMTAEQVSVPKTLDIPEGSCEMLSNSCLEKQGTLALRPYEVWWVSYGGLQN